MPSGNFSHDKTRLTRSACGMSSSNGVQNVACRPPITVSDPGQNIAAAIRPCFSAVFQIGSPPHHRGSASTSRFDSENSPGMSAARMLFEMMPWFASSQAGDDGVVIRKRLRRELRNQSFGAHAVGGELRAASAADTDRDSPSGSHRSRSGSTIARSAGAAPGGRPPAGTASVRCQQPHRLAKVAPRRRRRKPLEGQCRDHRANADRSCGWRDCWCRQQTPCRRPPTRRRVRETGRARRRRHGVPATPVPANVDTFPEAGSSILIL